MKTGIVTGCSRGIGKAITETFLATGAYYMIGTSTSGKSKIVHPNFESWKLDLSNTEEIVAFVEGLNKRPIDFLINNAGLLLDDPSNPVNRPTLEKTFQVNVFGTVELTELLLPQLVENGKIITISSDWGSFSESDFQAYPQAYKMSKAALNMYTKLLGQRLIHSSIQIAALDPGWVRTDMGGNSASRAPEEVAQELQEMIIKSFPSGKFWHKGNVRDW